MKYYPDRWLVVSIKNNQGEIHYRVFATWKGGYTSGDSWQLNSGIVRVEETEGTFDFYGESGSCYSCGKGFYGATVYGESVLNRMIETAEGLEIEVLPEDTNWCSLEFKEN